MKIPTRTATIASAAGTPTESSHSEKMVPPLLAESDATCRKIACMFMSWEERYIRYTRAYLRKKMTPIRFTIRFVQEDNIR
eukprot:1469725-Pyramimonas_sp.AAC.1